MNLGGARRAMVHAVEKEKEEEGGVDSTNGRPAFMCLDKQLAEAIRRDLDLVQPLHRTVSAIRKTVTDVLEKPANRRLLIMSSSTH